MVGFYLKQHSHAYLICRSKSFIDDNGDGFAREVLLGGDPVRATLGDEADKGESEETLNCPGDMNNNLDESHTGGSDDASNCSIFESTPCAPVSQNLSLIQLNMLKDLMHLLCLQA